MSLLVDECRWVWRGRRWCHLVSDQNLDELHRFVVGLGLPRRAFQGDHYDLHEDLRAAAVMLGAEPVDSRTLVRRLRHAGLRMRPGGARLAAPPLPADRVALVLARFHQILDVGAVISVSPTTLHGERLDRPLEPIELDDLLVGAGFSGDGERLRTLPDTVGPGMRHLVCGLNPSLVAADAGYGFSGATNRFWKAALAAGVTDRSADPWWALVAHGVGMTDLVKRATPRSSEVTREEYRLGAARVARIVERYQPGAVVFVGLEGWRAAINRRASTGWQPEGIGGRPAYVMPSTSGLNARVSIDELTRHMRTALAGR